jgi:hypothetical protein
MDVLPGCDTETTMAGLLEGDVEACGCVHLEGFVIDPTNPKSTLATELPTPIPSIIPTISPTLRTLATDGTHTCDLLTTMCIAKEEPDSTTVSTSSYGTRRGQ